MESFDDRLAPCRPSFLDSIELPERATNVYVDDIRANLLEEFSSVSSSSDTSQKSGLESKDHLEVFLRVRPLTALEVEQNESQDCVHIEDSTSVLLKAPNSSLASRLSEKGCTHMVQKFTFSHVFGPETSQREFFEGTVKESVMDVLDGRNRLIFTYGVTNAGKTYTFQGTPDHIGILPRCMNMLFSSIQKKHYSKMDLKPHRCRDYVRLTKDQVKKEIAIKNAVLRFTKEVESQSITQGGMSLESVDSIVEGNMQSSINSLPDFEDDLKESEQCNSNMSSLLRFSIWVSFCEIYNESIYDLLEPISNKFHKRKTLRLAQDIKGCSFVKDLQWIKVSDSREAYRLLHLGKKCQSFASTKLNSASSRSHSIFTFRMLRIEDTEIPRVTKVSELSLCDLAGSERCTKTRNVGDRLKESGNINTSLHILGKCINALKNNQQAKLPQHVPFRESKLTHYLQSFFCGKGKACMIVNISQAASVYDETLNVLKFSAVAQKVLLLDTSKPPAIVSLGKNKSSHDVSFIIDNADNKSWSSKKRATIHWDTRLEDVIEVDDNSDTDEDDQDSDGSLTDQSVEEEGMVKKDENNIILSEDEYQKLLDLVEDLKNKLVNEKKQNLIMELKIRNEIAKEFSEHLVQRDNDFSDCLKKERELLEERSDERIAIFQDLVSKCNEEPETAVEEIKAESSTTQAVSQDHDNSMSIDAFIESMQEDLAVIKKQAVAAQLNITAIPHSEGATSLEEQLLQVSAELSRTQEELIKKNKELEMQVNNLSRSTIQLEDATEKMAKQSSRIEELISIVSEKDSAVMKLQELLSHWEDTVENYDKSVKNMKGEILTMQSDGIYEAFLPCVSMNRCAPAGRKRPPENQHVLEEQPPAKKGMDQSVCTSLAAQQENIELPLNSFSAKAVIIDLQENLEVLQNRLTTLTDKLKDERAEKEKLKDELANTQLALSSSEKNASGLSDEVQHMTTNYEKLISEFQTQKEINNGQEEAMKTLMTEVENNKMNISEKVSQIKNIQVKIDLLRKEDIQTLDLEDSAQVHPACPGECALAATSTVPVDRHSSAFHCAIESLWKECKHVVEVSSKKNHHIQELEEMLARLKEEMERLKLENSQLKLTFSETSVLDNQQKEMEELVGELRKQLLESSCLLDAEKQVVLSVSSKLSETEKQNAGYEEKMKEFDCLLRTIENKNGCLEEQLLQKKSAIEELQQKHNASENKIQMLTCKEIHLKGEIEAMLNTLKSVQCSLEEKERQEETRKQEIEQLRKELSDSCAQEQSLKLDLDRKEEEYTDMKDKLADAKKQIQQVEREVCLTREENKCMFNKINEYEKIKNQMSQDLEMKQRTIQQLKKEQMDNRMVDLHQNCCKELQAKDRLIDDMRLTLLEQEQTQAEQDKALEAKIEEAVKLTAELEDWKNSCRLLENIKINPECHPLANEKSNVNNPMGEELLKIQETLKEFEEKHNTDRKKWIEEKMGLLAQTKEAEDHRNRDMRKFAEDRERHLKQQTYMENLSAQLFEKEKDLQKWREERDHLVAALEVQLKHLLSSNRQKDEEIEKLRENLLHGPEMESKNVARNPVGLQAASNCEKVTQNSSVTDDSKAQSAVATVTVSEVEELITEKANEENTQKSCTEHQMKRKVDSSSHFIEASSIDESENHSDAVLDSSALSTENGKTSRFPKPQLEIQFSPLQPNKMEVKHQGSASPVTVKINRNMRKRKSHEMDKNNMLARCWKSTFREKQTSEVICQDMVMSENKKNATPRTANTLCSRATPSTNNQKTFTRKESSLRKQISTSSTLSARKKDGTLQKIGDLLHSSPAIFHTKAKQLIKTMSTSKPAEVDRPKENETKAKRSRRKLYTTDISTPLDIPAHRVIMDNNTKESDHLIMKRRLRSKTAK